MKIDCVRLLLGASTVALGFAAAQPAFAQEQQEQEQQEQASAPAAPEATGDIVVTGVLHGYK